MGVCTTSCFLVHGPNEEGGADAGPVIDGSSCVLEDGVSRFAPEERCSCTPEGAVRAPEGIAIGDDVGVCDGVTRFHPYGQFDGAFCLDGLVYWLNDLGGFIGTSLQQCFAPRPCAYFYSEIVGLEPPLPCAYSDLTRATTGVIPPVDCAMARASGQCGSNCPCNVDRHCYGLSEEHPLGACVITDGSGSGLCGPDIEEPCAPDEHCMRPLDRPEWLDLPNLRILYPVNRGRCVERDVCTAMTVEYPGVWECVDF